MIQEYVDFINDAISHDGTVGPGPWGNNDNDRTVSVTIPYDGGHFLVWLVDREISMPVTREKRSEVWKCAWFIVETRVSQNLMVHDERALPIEMVEPFNFQGLVDSLDFCPCCKKDVGRENISHVGFAGSACDACLPAARKAQEFPGWTK
jgi:hypothetical protein